LAASVNITSSASSPSARPLKLDTSNADLTAQCRRWDAIAANAAHPDAATIARHDKLMQKAADLEAAAVKLQGPVREAAIRNIAQAHVEAAADTTQPGSAGSALSG
jgi:hypothetical protein